MLGIPKPNIPKRKAIVVGVLVLVTLIFLINGGKRIGSASQASKCQVTIAVDTLNVRSQPEDTGGVVSSYHRGDTVDSTTTVVAGYRQLSQDHWIADRFVQPTSGSKC